MFKDQQKPKMYTDLVGKEQKEMGLRGQGAYFILTRQQHKHKDEYRNP